MARQGSIDQPPPLDWVPYSQTLFEKQVNAGKTVLVNYRASWDISSAVIEKQTWTDAELREEFRQRRVVLLVVDLTVNNPAFEAALSAVPSESIPVVAFYRRGSPAPYKVLRDIVTPEQVLEALREP